MVQNPNVVSDEISEIALPPGVFAQLQDATKGGVRTYVGPALINQTGQETPVVYDHKQRTFRECSLRDTIRKMPIAEEGDYLVLENPAEGDKHPNLGESKQDCPDLKMGSKVNVPGPTQFALWPGQHATLVPGHNLRSNQYLACRVYNETAAMANWQEATIVKAEAKEGEEGEESEDPRVDVARKFIAGQRIIIRGDKVSFFIPPTGIEVLADDRGNGRASYVREAITLERLEYCILVDEDGNKRYERGPQVVFPEPTETFLTDGSVRKFKAFELNLIQGLHVKVIAAYTEDAAGGGEVVHTEGEELFITGEKQPIYFPRQEHSIIKYGDRNKQFATAIPPGEGRYVMDRETGEITTEEGPEMLLPDPRHQVIVRRILTENQSELWYPGNQQAMAYNQELSRQASSAGLQSLGYLNAAPGDLDALESSGSGDTYRSIVQREKSGDPTMPDEFSRGTQYSPPRTLTLDTKFEGVPQVCPWTGYAIMVVDKSGHRRVENGPTTVLLNFDEALEILTLSTGKPKSTDKLLRTVYLRVMNNKISDIVQNVFTSDHVPVDLKLSFTVNFEGEPENWFNIENYVKFLCDHVRSVLKGRIRKLGIKEFWSGGADFIRDYVLGPSVDGSRPGMVFEQNGMRITDVEILDIEIRNREIAAMLQSAEEDVVSSNISLEKAERELINLARREEIDRHTLEAKFKTAGLKLKLEKARVDDELKVSLARQVASQEVSKAGQLAAVESEKIVDIRESSLLARSKDLNDQRLGREAEEMRLRVDEVKAETEACEKRFAAMQDGFHEALLTLGNQDALVKIAQAGSVQKMVGGSSLVEAVSSMIGNGGLSDKITEIAKRAGVSLLDE